ATVTDVYQLSKTVKGLKLKVHDKSFSFQPGQWLVDFFISGLDKIAGYSICTSPEYFIETNLIELAVKYSIYPPTLWVHEECKIGSQVDIAVGGQFFFNSSVYLRSLTSSPEKDHKNRKGNLLLIAGGVGINPIISILRHVVRNSSVLENKMNVLLLYCASDEDELIFKVRSLIMIHDLITKFFKLNTQPKNSESQRLNEDSLKMRIERRFNRDALDDLTCYLCGPNEMIDSLSGALYKLGLPQDRVLYEKWW
ncbi:hypothetical protein HELRODRAFT_88429, partial [Helobdella robusta]|uniref:Oxidoreductase FAD/NAD(P)-binding domain-containing protein n=1 Tax=Helobdella robusta TaxID=6412 RepID=T1G724_HELRO